MEIAIGAILALSACGLGVVAGFERDRAYYPVMLIVIASYYDLFAVIGGDQTVLSVEVAISLGFAALAVIGFRLNLWLAVAGLIGHAVLDVFHGHVVTNTGLPNWWPMFCASFDAVAGLYLAWRLVSKRIDASDRQSFGNRIRIYVDVELAASERAERAGDLLAGSLSRACAHPGSAIDGAACARAHADALVGRAQSQGARGPGPIQPCDRRGD